MINKESGVYFSQFISEQVKKNLRKYQAEFREKLRKLRFKQNNSIIILFSYKRNVYHIIGLPDIISHILVGNNPLVT